MMETTRAEIEACLASGNAASQVALGRRLEAEGKQSLARGVFANAAKLGSVDAIRLLAINLMTRQPLGIADGINMLKSAAEKADAEAVHLCAVIAAQDSELRDRYNVALDYLVQAADLGSEMAQAELRTLGQASSSETDWKKLRDGLDLTAWTQIPQGEKLRTSPRVETFERFISPQICDWFISRARTRLGPATVYNPDTGDHGLKSQDRTNTTAMFPIAEADVIFMLVQSRIMALTGLRAVKLEPPVVLHYEIGQQFAPHFDFLNPRIAAYAKELAEIGQRVATFLIYLNEEFDGGETEFPLLDLKFKGKKGDAILFWNVDRSGVPDERTRHAGLAPTSGEKWLLSQWLREQPSS
jgi:hypothetical protein